MQPCPFSKRIATSLTHQPGLIMQSGSCKSRHNFWSLPCLPLGLAILHPAESLAKDDLRSVPQQHTARTSGWGTSVSARPFLLDRSRSYTVEPAILRLSESFSRYDTPNLRVRNIHLPLGRLKPSKVPLARYCCCSHPASSTSRWTSLRARLFGHPGRGSDKELSLLAAAR
ncbi:hypothetical protein BJ166DRAFT_168941 [Pestalotiopsis sp. NC0098]|nr:hypothetical protein BJ166DRAFT_168941 [Pestalotiopsis sp. NC0098]